jgi:hypothetical protein
MIKPSVLVLGSALLVLSPLGFANPVSNATIVKWLINPDSAQGSPQKIQIEKTQAIKLANGEQALLSSVQFAEAGRNFWGGYILTRPDLKKSLILEKFGGQANEFKVLSNAHPMTLLQLSAAGSGQGDVDQTDYIVGFKGWVAQVLYEADSFSHGFGRYTAVDDPQQQCEEQTTRYDFKDKKPAPQLTETVRYYKGPCIDKIPAKAYRSKTRTINLKFS